MSKEEFVEVFELARTPHYVVCSGPEGWRGSTEEGERGITWVLCDLRSAKLV